MTKTIRFLSLALAVALAGCGDDDGNEPNPSIAVSLGGAVTVVQGQTGTTEVTVSRGGGFSGAVSLTATALPVGVTATFDPASIPAGTGNGTSTLTLAAAENAPTGAGTFTVAANGGANLDATVNGSVTVQPKPDFSLNVTPNAVAIDQGSTGVLNVAITRAGGFVGPVDLSVTDLPTGVTAAFDNAAPTGNTAVLTLTAAADATLGPANITLSGTGDPGTRTAQFTMTVQTPPGAFTLTANPTTVAITQGTTGQSTITVNKTGSFTEAVALTVTGLPDGVTASFDPTSASAAKASKDVQTTSVLTLTVGAGATAGDHPLVIHGNAEGQTEKTVNLTLTVNAAPVNGFTLALNPSTLSVAAGANGTTTVTISKTGTFNSTVALSVQDLPTGVTAAFNPASASAGKSAGKSPSKTTDTQTESTLTLTVANTVAAQDYDLTVRGASEGQPNADVPLTLTVTAAPGDFSLAVNPTTVSIQQGQNGNATVTISKTGSFTGDVTLSAVGLPANVTASFNPPAASPPRASLTRDVETTSTMTLTVAGSVATNNYQFQIKGVAEGKEDKLIDATLTVTPPPGPGNSSIKFCDLANLPIWFAYKDGNGAWTQVTGVVAGDGTTYTFTIDQSTGAYAWVLGTAGTGFTTTVTYGTQAQLTGNTGQCPTAPHTRTLNGSVAGMGATDQAVISMGGAGANASTLQPNFTLQNVLDGASDLIAVRSTVGGGLPPAITPAGIIIRRGLNIANNGTIPVLDFSAAEAFAPETKLATITGAGADNLIVTMAYITPTAQGTLTSALLPTSPVTVHGVPAAKQDANDLHQLSAFAATDAGDARGHLMWFKTLADKTIDLGVGLTTPTTSNLGNAPYPRLQSTGPIQSIYDDVFNFTSQQVSGVATENRIWTISVLKGFFTGANYTMAIEDLTAAGYQTTWALKTGVLTNLLTLATGFSNNGIANPILEGGFADFASKNGQITP